MASETDSTGGTNESCQTEDEAFARIVGVRDCRWWDFPEAPQRGYTSLEQQLEGAMQNDTIWLPISQRLCKIQEELHPDAVFAPQGVGNHVDHLQTILALCAAGNLIDQIHWYRDMPYAMNHPEAPPSPLLPAGLQRECIGLKEMDLERKVLGCSAYSSQIDIHFGTASEVGSKLRAFHHFESQHLEEGQLERYAECFLTSTELPPLF